MESQVVSWVITSLMGVALWFMKNTLLDTKVELKRLDNELQRVRLEYLHKDDFREFKIELRTMFEEIKRDIKDLKSDA